MQLENIQPTCGGLLREFFVGATFLAASHGYFASSGEASTGHQQQDSKARQLPKPGAHALKLTLQTFENSVNDGTLLLMNLPMHWSAGLALLDHRS